MSDSPNSSIKRPPGNSHQKRTLSRMLKRAGIAGTNMPTKPVLNLDEKRTVTQRVLGFVEHNLFITPVMVIGGIVGMFLYTPVLAAVGICILLAFHRSGAVSGLSKKTQIIWYAVLFCVTVGSLYGIGILIKKRVPQLATRQDIVAMLEKLKSQQKDSSPPPNPSPTQSATPLPQETDAEKRKFIEALARKYKKAHPELGIQRDLYPQSAFYWINQELKRQGKTFRVEIPPEPQQPIGIVMGDGVALKLDHSGIIAPQPIRAGNNSRLELDHSQISMPPTSTPLPVRKLTFTQEPTNSTREDAPYAVKVVIQTNVTIKPVSIVVKCDSEATSGDFRMAGTYTFFDSGYGHTDGDKRNFWFHFKDEFKPETPITALIMSAHPIKALAVMEVPYQ